MKYFVLMLLSLAATAFAQDFTYEVTITNLTKGQIISPPVVASHYRDVTIFTPGEAASEPLAQLAEDGMAAPLVEALEGVDLVYDVAAADGPVLPGESVTIEVTVTGVYNRISAVGMLVTTNDAFFGLDSAEVYTFNFKKAIPRKSRHFVGAWDAGSEANSEGCDYIPGPPCGNGGVRDTENAEGYVYPHPGLHGEGDISLSGYNWQGAVVMVEITRI